MNRESKESFRDSYARLKKELSKSSDASEVAELRRKWLQLSCEASAQTSDNEATGQLFTDLYTNYSEKRQHCPPFDPKSKDSGRVNNSSKWKSSLSNNLLLSELKNTPQIGADNVRMKIEMLRKVMAIKSDYVPQKLKPVFGPQSRVTNIPKVIGTNKAEEDARSNNLSGAAFRNDVNKENNTEVLENDVDKEGIVGPNYGYRHNSRRSNHGGRINEDSPGPSNYRGRNNSSKVVIDEQEASKKYDVFRTARDELNMQNVKKYGSNAVLQSEPKRRRLGLRGPGRKFVSPMLSNNSSSGDEVAKGSDTQEPVDERLKNIDPKMVELIRSEIMDTGPTIDWNDIAGLEFAKNAIQEAVVWPMLRPDIFTGLRRPPKGILLFGPPGTGKTLIGKCVASQSHSTFFSISASSLTSKWVGDGEKMVRALFAVARCHQPVVIFIDEIDSLLSQRSDSEHESSRRIKTEFLVQLDGATTSNEERLLLIGATNRPQELDEAARRRFVKRLYIPLPEMEARCQLVGRLMSTERHTLTDENLELISKLSDGYSGADMRNLCADASMGPIRSIHISQIQNIQAQEVRPVSMEDFLKSLNRVRPSVSPKDLEQYIVWDNTYGSGVF